MPLDKQVLRRARSAPRTAGQRTYQLEIDLSRRIRCRIGMLGAFVFPKGRYVYTGSARRNLASRIARHLTRRKQLHWHIDYLLSRRAAAIRRVLTFTAPECEINRRTPGRIVAPGFGSSDCREGCGAHLKFQLGFEARRHERGERTRRLGSPL